MLEWLANNYKRFGCNLDFITNRCAGWRLCLLGAGYRIGRLQGGGGVCRVHGGGVACRL